MKTTAVKKLLPVSDEERWILSFYRDSEISGAMFFGRIARFLPAGQMQHDMTRHFADESAHAALWTETLYNLDCKPQRCKNAYQDAYLDAAGLPVNMMEILALTNVFERRVLTQYQQHLQLPNLNPRIGTTLNAIMDDEQWHILWIDKALNNMAETYGRETIDKKLAYYQAADDEVYAKAVAESDERLRFLFGQRADQIVNNAGNT